MQARVVIALVNERAVSRLRTAVPEVVMCASRIDAERRLRGVDCTALILDPTAPGVTLGWIRGLRGEFPSTPFLIYAELAATAFAPLAEFVRGGFADVVLRGYDDSPDRLMRLLDNAGSRLRAGSALRDLEPVLRSLPPRLHSAVVAMFRNPHRYRSTHDLASEAQMSVRAVFRHVDSAGLTSARRLVASARVLRAFDLLTHGRTARDAAERLRYSSPDQMCAHFVELVGLTPAEVKHGVEQGSFQSRLIQSLLIRRRRRSEELVAVTI